MFHTAHETTEQTLTRLIRAWDNRRAVTITYRKADGTETVRTLEIYDIQVTAVGDIVIKAMDRQSGESRSFRLDRIDAYSVHRSGYQVERAEDDAEPARTVPSLRMALETVAGLELVPVDTAARVALLADTLAA